MINKKELKDSLKYLWDKTVPTEEFNLEEGLNDLYSRVNIYEYNKKKRRNTIIRYASIAASIALLMVTEYFFLGHYNTKAEVYTCVAPSNTKGEFVLPDGTKVWLNSGASLKYTSDFLESKTRDVQLDGEAYFDVTKSNRQFVVDMGTVDIAVYGTSFCARNSHNFLEQEVTLQSGSVAIMLDGTIYANLRPGERFAYDQFKGIASVSEVNTALFCDWINNELEFYNQSLHDILISLEHWYNVEISTSSKIDLDVKLSLKVKSESLQETISLISALIGCRYKIIDSDNVILD